MSEAIDPKRIVSIHQKFKPQAIQITKEDVDKTIKIGPHSIIINEYGDEYCSFNDPVFFHSITNEKFIKFGDWIIVDGDGRISTLNDEEFNKIYEIEGE